MSKHILNTPFTDITFEPEYKVSLWVGIGADGKSAFQRLTIKSFMNG